MTTKATKLVSLGRAAAAITFTRINNNRVQARKRPASKNARAATQPSCVAWFKQPRFPFSTSVKLAFAVLSASLLFAAPAMAELNLEKFAISAQNENGTPDTQAGSHPYALTNTFVLSGAGPENSLKDVHLELPPGFVGDPTATPKCTYQEFIEQATSTQESGCSNEAAIGLATTYLTSVKTPGAVDPTTDPVYNLVPPAGVAAEFGFVVAGTTPVFLDTSVRTGTDYGLTTTVSNINQGVLVGASKVTIWGVPASPVHDAYRGTCLWTVAGEETPVETPGLGLRAGEDE